ncbi:MAG: hypothetical protein ABII26_03450, partial [Pseudomonadota bacterium]
ALFKINKLSSAEIIIKVWERKDVLGAFLNGLTTRINISLDNRCPIRYSHMKFGKGIVTGHGFLPDHRWAIR